MTGALEKGLIVLVADRNMQAAVEGVLLRHKALDVAAIDFDIERHPERDPGCRNEGVALLGLFHRRYAHAILMFDWEGCGAKEQSAEALEQKLEQDLQALWGDRARVIIIDPELESWVWSDSPHVEDILLWKGRKPGLQAWLREKKFEFAESGKPLRPKEAMEAALREARKPLSSSIFQSLAETVGFSCCTDRAFGKLRATLAEWFPEQGAHQGDG